MGSGSGTAQVMPCVDSATQGLIRLTPVGGDYLSKLGGLPKCAGISRREMGLSVFWLLRWQVYLLVTG